MIDSASETLITLIQAADELPRRRRGPKTHISTLFRWSTAGCRGVVLETIQVGRTRCTSREALQRFFERLSQVAQIEAARRAQSQRKSIGGRRTVAQRQAANAGCMLSRLVPSTNSPPISKSPSDLGANARFAKCQRNRDLAGGARGDPSPCDVGHGAALATLTPGRRIANQRAAHSKRRR